MVRLIRMSRGRIQKFYFFFIAPNNVIMIAWHCAVECLELKLAIVSFTFFHYSIFSVVSVVL